MHTLTAIIITKNEAHNMADCIASLRQWVDAVVVFDSGSTDGTQDAARAAGALVMLRPWDNFAAQRQAALDAVESRWILFVDADERATAPLAAEVRALVQADDAAIAGYWIPRRNFIVGQEMRYGGYFPDYQLRLLRRGRAQYDAAREVHEVVQLAGEAGYLREPLIHYNYTSWAQFHRKQHQYAAYEALILAGRGIRPRPHNFVLQPLREFRRRYITLQGWRDGVGGLRLALLLAWYYGFMPYVYLARGFDNSGAS
ncbi:MAG: glycosyltransferase family 2 protein [Caldilineaceae bacterium]|nr:glycosyltransferase family 2 protein [Caldilineaceae bacterium]